MDRNKKLIWLLIVGLLVSMNLALAASQASDLPQRQHGAAKASQTQYQRVAEPREARMPGHMDRVPQALHGQSGPWVAPRNEHPALDDPSEVWVDDDYSFGNSGSHTWGTDAFATIQDGIDAVAVGGIVNVYPGSYNESASGRFLFDSSGPYQFGLFVGTAKGGITVRGVDAVGTPITDCTATLPEVIYTATNSFGTSGIFVEGDNVTITGLHVHNASGQEVNKTFEIIGNNFTLRYCKVADWDETYLYGGSVYINDWRYDSMSETAYLQTYTIDHNCFPIGNSVDVASGAGATGAASGRQITNNSFDLAGQNYNSISFSGTTPAVGWYLYPIGGATITGNTFVNGSAQYVKARGAYDNSTFDWASIWSANTYDKKAVMGVNPPSDLRAYSYDVFTNTRRIGTLIQGEIDNAQSGDIVLVGAGTYDETPIIGTSLTLRSETLHAANIVLQPGVDYTDAIWIQSVDNVTVDGFTVTGHDAAEPVLASTNFYVDLGSDNTTIENNLIKVGNIDDGTTGDDGFGLITVYSGSVQITNLTVTGNTFEAVNTVGRRAFYINPGVDGFHFADNTVSGMVARSFTQAKNGLIEENTITGIGAAGSRGGGVGAYGDPDGTVWGNTIFRHNSVTGCYNGVAVLGANNCLVERNAISACDVGIDVEDYDLTWDPSTFKAWKNSITGSYSFALDNLTATTVNGSGNWWGALPVWGTLLDGSVDYTPWCQLDGTYDTPGFTPNLSQLMVEAASPQTGLVNRVQEGVDLTVGSTVNLSAGTFVGQVHIALNNLNLVGAGVASTTVKADPTAMPLADGDGTKPVIFVDGATNVHITNLKVDGDGKAAVNGNNMSGISYWNADGLIQNVDVVNVNGGTYGYAIYANNNDVPAHVLNLTNINVSTYQYQGVTLNGTGLSASLNNVTATGGSLAGLWQAGIFVMDGASADITGCATSNNYDPTHYWFTAGYLVYGQADILNSTSINDADGIDIEDPDGDCSVTGCDVTTIYGYSVYAVNISAMLVNNDTRSQAPSIALRNHRLPERVIAQEHSSALDDIITVLVSGCNVTGPGATADFAAGIVGGSSDAGTQLNFTVQNCSATGFQAGILSSAYLNSTTSTIFTNNVVSNNVVGSYAYPDRGSIILESSNNGVNTATVTGNKVINCADRGMLVYEWQDGFGGYTPATINASITNNTFDAAPSNTLDDHPSYVAGRWDANCYSDYNNLHAGYPDYNIGGGVQVDLNPNANSCADVDIVTTSDLIGCPGGCVNDTLYFRLDQAGYYSGQLIMQLPASLSSYLTPVMSEVAPAAGPMRTANLLHTFARSLPGNQIELNPIWGALDPSVADGEFFACVPVYNTSSTHGQTLVVTPVSYDFADVNGEHTSDLYIGNTTLTVDCDDPSATLTGGAGESGCNAYNSAAEFNNQLNYTMAAAGLNGPPIAPLASAYIKLGVQTWPLALANGTFPVGTEVPSVWTTMSEGCNTFELHVFDTECNDSVATLGNIVKDVQAPLPSVVYLQSDCYNNIPTDPQYGATLIDGDLDIDLAAALACQASTFSLSFTVNTIPIGEGLSGVTDITDYPFGTHAQDLWDDIVGVIGGGYSGFVTIGWRVTDCAGNISIGSFMIPCVDFSAPDNEFTAFDARPTYDGVWLKWTWAAGGTGATAMEVWRKGEGTYPVYGGNLSMSDGNYEKVHANLAANGWTMAVSQSGPNYTSSPADYTGTHGGPGNAYWKDNISDLTRDIYRYVTFVRDGAGNWSVVGSYTLLTNADRSTNYWLGDYTLHSGNPTPFGVVEGVDLGLLSAHYFETVGPAPSYLDIGPENHENAYGKGIPDPDQAIDFFDLLPFSYNYGVAAATGFSVQVPSGKPFDQLDAAPVVSVTRANDGLLEVGSVFDVVVTLTGNTDHAAKLAEAQLEFDPNVLEIVSVTPGAVEVADGVPWSKACAIPGVPNRIGATVAALGEIATINGDVTMATIQFRWKAEQTGSTDVQILATHMADAYGHVIDGEAGTLGLGATGIIPTSYALYQNYPNPFNPTTQIRYDLPEDAQVRLVIYNMMGQEVRTLINGTMPAGAHHITWDGLNNGGQSVGTGLYVYRINANRFSATHKMLLTR